MGLAAASILPMLLLFSGAAYVNYRAERTRAGERQLALARSMAATVEREQHAALVGLTALSVSNALLADDMEKFRGLATRLLATEPKGSVIILLDRSGQHLVNTAVPPGKPLPRRDPVVNETLTKQVFDTAQPVISNLVQRRPGGQPIVTADMPVLRGSRVIYDVCLVLPATRFRDILAAQILPPGAVSSVFDRAGVNVARMPNGDRFTGVTASPSLLPTLQSQAEGVLPTISREGVRLLTAFSHTQPSGWAVALGVPEADLRAPLMRSLRLAATAGIAGLLLSALVAYVMARRILKPIAALTQLAASPDGSAPRVLGISELENVATALRHSLRDRQAAMEALQALNEGLENRIRQETATRLHAQAQLAQAQRMEALGQLAGGIAHDFNNVLQAVSGGLSLIARRAEDPEAVRRLAERATQAANRGAAVTGRLLTFARRGELAGTQIDPAGLLADLRDMLAHTLGAAIHITVDAPAGLPCLLADRAQLETVLVNLAVNARDAMPSGGDLNLAARACHLPDNVAHPAGLSPGDYIELVLRDTGRGMDPAVLARAIEPFFTTKPPGEGTGLGLAMARGFAQQSGGGLSLESAPGAGTTVHLWLPQDTNPLNAPALERPADDNPQPLPPMRVLLVDDDAMVREIMTSELAERGFAITAASDGPAALALIDSGLRPELLITDHAMPGMDGLTLIAEARRRRHALPAIMLTGYAEGSVQESLLAAQDRLTVLLQKPIGGEALARRAASLRRGRRPGTLPNGQAGD